MSAVIVQRRCVSCRSVRPADELLRFRLTLEQGMVSSPRFCSDRRGRGYYVCVDRMCLERASKMATGRLGGEFNSKAILRTLLQQSCEQWSQSAKARATGLARRGHNSHDARLRRWLNVVSKLTTIIEQSDTQHLGA